MTTTTITALADFKATLLRKGLVGAVLVAPYSATTVTDICGASGALQALTGFKSVGRLDPAGIVIADTPTTAEVRSWGDVSAPGRIDITTVASTITFTAQETRSSTIDAYHNVDQTNVQANFTTGTIKFDKPTAPALRDQRVLAIMRDTNRATGLDIYYAVYYPRANITPSGTQTMSSANELQYGLVANALVDDTEGTAARIMWGGPGLAGLVVPMGYTTATS